MLVLKISDIRLQIRLRFGMANKINMDLRLKPSTQTLRNFNLISIKTKSESKVFIVDQLRYYLVSNLKTLNFPRKNPIIFNSCIFYLKTKYFDKNEFMISTDIDVKSKKEIFFVACFLMFLSLLYTEM